MEVLIPFGSCELLNDNNSRTSRGNCIIILESCGSVSIYIFVLYLYLYKGKT